MNAAGAVTGRASFSTSGAKSTTGAATTLGFTGALADALTSLVYLQARDLDPVTAQFLPIDPQERNTRLAYTYAANTPPFTDPLGLSAEDAWAVVGIIGLGFAAVALTATGIRAVADPLIAAGETALVAEVTTDAIITTATDAGGEIVAESIAEETTVSVGRAVSSETAEAAAGTSRLVGTIKDVGTAAGFAGTGIDTVDCAVNHLLRTCLAAVMRAGALAP